MCTVTIIPLSADQAGTRLACNRDESRRRAPALPPIVRSFGARRAILPIDPVSDGTWIAVNDAGLTLTLLNVYQPMECDQSPSLPAQPTASATPPDAHQSRGTIIPSLLHLRDTGQVAAQFDNFFDPTRFAPFRLVAVDRNMVIDLHGDGSRVHLRSAVRNIAPLLFTSSGLGDQVVEGPRRALFTEFFTEESDGPSRQNAYHRHFWPDRRHISVCMSRETARTVSFTVVEVAAESVVMHYHPEAPDIPAEAVSVTLPRTEWNL